MRKALATNWWKPDLSLLKEAIAASLVEDDRRSAIILTKNKRMDWRRVDDLMVRVDYMVFKRDGIGRMIQEALLAELTHREMHSRPASHQPGML